jgi:hypothetical protein
VADAKEGVVTMEQSASVERGEGRGIENCRRRKTMVVGEGGVLRKEARLRRERKEKKWRGKEERRNEEG